MGSDLGNVGVQRQVLRYERIERFTDPEPTWVAILDCGHEAKLAEGYEPPVMPGRPAPGGRYIDCPDCTRLQQAEGA